MTHLKRSISAVVILIALLGSACGVPRADLEQERRERLAEKQAFTERIRRLEEELTRLKSRLSEKEAQFESLFKRFEMLSRDYLKLKRGAETPPDIL